MSEIVTPEIEREATRIGRMGAAMLWELDQLQQQGVTNVRIPADIMLRLLRAALAADPNKPPEHS